MAVYDDLGANACRILVPGYSEIYPVEDLIWDNTNKALIFRSDILNLHSLSDMRLRSLLKSLEQCEVDDYTDITTLIGIEFDDNTVWGQLTILELKLLIYLALKQFEPAKELTEAFLQYNDNTVERGLFYQALNVVLEVQLDDELELADYEANFRRMFGNERMDTAIGSVDGSVRFYGLTPTSLKLEGPGQAPAPDRELPEAARRARQGRWFGRLSTALTGPAQSAYSAVLRSMVLCTCDTRFTGKPPRSAGHPGAAWAMMRALVHAG